MENNAMNPTENQQSNTAAEQVQAVPQEQNSAAQPTKFCKFCGGKIHADAVLCTLCGRQVEEMHQAAQPQQIVINNSNNNSNVNTNVAGGAFGKPKNKWVAFLICILFGWMGAHKFYEGKGLMGVLYLFTFGLFGIGWFIDTIALLFKPNPYYV